MILPRRQTEAKQRRIPRDVGEHQDLRGRQQKGARKESTQKDGHTRRPGGDHVTGTRGGQVPGQCCESNQVLPRG